MHLVAALVLAASLLGAEATVLNQQLCMSSENIRNKHIDEHNALRRKAGLGELIYDCKLEDKTVEKRNFKKHAGDSFLQFIEFVCSNKSRNHAKTLQCAYDELKTNPHAVKLITDPAVTGFACTEMVVYNKMNIMCVYEGTNWANAADPIFLTKECR
ncbi:hypothetical protein OESDEN_14987 [Oesophagostomum dentatum]|uniref:SCP-like protein n=1 Tax=Oesophagostomum dentatum TaxID=61180 RepID=A0A0B1SQ18_OESDE|nr:hypothetical protein OESDEN_14987 [Oesophagostomum dentatum]